LFGNQRTDYFVQHVSTVVAALSTFVESVATEVESVDVAVLFSVAFPQEETAIAITKIAKIVAFFICFVLFVF